MTASPPACLRCRQTLPEGSGYCVACGCTNDSAYEKLIANENKIEQRRFWNQFWKFAGAYPIFRWFR